VGSAEAVPIRCAFTDFRARNGQVDVLTRLVDTTDTRFSGDGSINLDDERVDRVLTPDPKDFSLFAFPTPFITGRFSNPAIYPDYSEFLTPTTVTVPLGLVATPFAALIPLIEKESGEDAAYKALLDTASEERRDALQEDDQRPHPKVRFMRQGQ
jgi:AsmA family protein